MVLVKSRAMDWRKSMNKNDFEKSISIIKSTIIKLDLNLRNFTVLTEIGTGPYLYTPYIAALAGAKMVYAYSKNTVFGTVDDIRVEAQQLNKFLGSLPVRIVEDFTDVEICHSVDILTNSGMLRPLTADFLSNFDAKKLVIPLMYESWELRKTDLDLSFCSEKRIKVGGTNENHSSLNVFRTTGNLSAKMAFDAGSEIADCKVLIWSDDDFGHVAARTFKSLGAIEVEMTTDENVVNERFDSVDLIYFCRNSEDKQLIGEKGILNPETIASAASLPTIIHLYGKLDKDFCKGLGLKIFPEQDGKSRSMSLSLSYLGVRPVFSLLAAGFKVGEIMKKNQDNGLCQRLVG